MSSPITVGIQIQSKTWKNLGIKYICVHVFMCVILLISIKLGVDLVAHDKARSKHTKK